MKFPSHTVKRKAELLFQTMVSLQILKISPDHHMPYKGKKKTIFLAMSPEIWMLWGVSSCDFKKGFKPGQMPPAQPQAKSAQDQVGCPGTSSTLYYPSLILRVTSNAAKQHQEQLSALVHASCGSRRPSSPVPSPAGIPLWAHQPSWPMKQATLSHQTLKI